MRYFITNKPYNMICQFTQEVEGQLTLMDLDFEFDKDVYPVGRLDLDSEGLLLLTNDRKLTHTLLAPQFQHSRTYLAQVEGIATDNNLDKLRNGVVIKLDKKKIHHTLPAKARNIMNIDAYFAPNKLWQRVPPARPSGQNPMSWIEIMLSEGKNRQVRKMCAAIGHPCLRLIRVGIVNLKLGDLPPGQVREITSESINSFF